jgi:hypothetical protein
MAAKKSPQGRTRNKVKETKREPSKGGEPRNKQEAEDLAKQGTTGVLHGILEALGDKGALAQKLAKLDGIDTKLGEHTTKLGEHTTKLGSIDGKLAKLDSVDTKLSKLGDVEQILRRILESIAHMKT